MLPFIDIEARRESKKNEKLNKKYSTYANEIFIEGKIEKKIEKTKKVEKLKIGFQFLKKKMIDKLMKSTSTTENEKIDKNGNQMFLDVILIKPMKLHIGHLKITERTLMFCYNANE